MTLELTKLRTRSQPADGAGGEPMDAGGPSPLQQQAAAFGNIARVARQSCAQGPEAERVLERRRNRSGQ